MTCIWLTNWNEWIDQSHATPNCFTFTFSFEARYSEYGGACGANWRRIWEHYCCWNRLTPDASGDDLSHSRNFSVPTPQGQDEWRDGRTASAAGRQSPNPVCYSPPSLQESSLPLSSNPLTSTVPLRGRAEHEYLKSPFKQSEALKNTSPMTANSIGTFRAHMLSTVETMTRILLEANKNMSVKKCFVPIFPIIFMLTISLV